MASELKQRVVRASNLNFTVLEMGEGPLVLCLHGFPDTAHSFRHQMPMLASGGIPRRRAVHARIRANRAPRPTDATTFAGARRGRPRADRRARRRRDAILFGHDWGAVAAYEAAAVAPKKVTQADNGRGSVWPAIFPGARHQLRAAEALLVHVFLSERDRGDGGVAE